jgi:integrase
VQLVIQNKIEAYLERKYRVSRSFATRDSYRFAVYRFVDYIQIQYNQDFEKFLGTIKHSDADPIGILDEYFTYLASGEKPLASNTIRKYLTIAKDFLNYLGCRIYIEDIKQRFRLPKARHAYEEGLTKETINRILRFANPKLATSILMLCSSGMRISELLQLRIQDIDFTKNPTTIIVKAETTKTRETRVTCISSEATNALQDYIKRYKITNYLFIRDNHKSDEDYIKNLIVTRQSFERMLRHVRSNIPELNKKNENGRNAIHFHALRAWFKTQVTDAHQSDFAEALMGHKSLKLVYYRQNENARAKTYLDVEHSLTIAETEKIDQDYSKLQKDNLELHGIVENLSRQLQNLERKIKQSTY